MWIYTQEWDYMIAQFLIFWGTTVLFSLVVLPFYSPTNSAQVFQWVPVFPYTCQHWLFSVFLLISFSLVIFFNPFKFLFSSFSFLSFWKSIKFSSSTIILLLLLPQRWRRVSFTLALGFLAGFSRNDYDPVRATGAQNLK